MKRRVTLVLLLLVWGAAGAIVNVAVAWGCALVAIDVWTTVPVPLDDVMYVRLLSRHPVDESFVRFAGYGMVEERFGVTRRALGYGSGFGYVDCDVQAGLPMRCLRGLDRWTTRPDGEPAEGFWDITLPFGTTGAVPLRPIWPGFAINTVFYAGILWLLFAAPFALRRRWRIRRGLCPKCAYPVGTWGGDVCTECGTAHAPRAPRAPHARPNA